MRVSRFLPTVVVGLASIHLVATGCSDKGDNGPAGFDAVDAAVADTSVPETAPPPVLDTDSGPGGPVIVDGGGGLSDAKPQVDAEGCTIDAGTVIPPVTRACLAATSNECDGTHDLPTYPQN